MKIPHWIAVLTLLASVSLYAEVYVGYQTSDCSKEKDFVIAGSVQELKKYDNQNDDWTLRSYKRVDPPEDCVEYTGSVKSPFVTPGSLPDNTEAAVVFIPAPFPVEILSSDFDAEKNQELLDSWQPETAKREPIATWVGPETDTMWTHITPYEWEITSEPSGGTYGSLIFFEKPYKIKIYIETIYRDAKANNLPFEHVVMQVQMEEHIHAIQLDAEENDADKLRKLTRADEFAMDFEAKTLIQEVIWPYIYGMQPPYLMRPVEKPADYDANREEYNELWVKDKLYGLNWFDNKRFLELDEYFTDDVPKVNSYPNPNYEGESNTGDEEE